jgi:hypothetical protein
MEMYKGWAIEQNEFGYWEAINLKNCDAQVMFAKLLSVLKIQIDELD